MSYGNDYSNKPFERASKTSHTNIINDAAVQSFLSKCKIPPYFEEIDDKDVELHMLEELDENPIKNIITIDGGWSYIGELVFNMLVLVGAVKMSDRVVREMMGL